MYHFYVRLLFIIGFLFGIFLACLLSILSSKHNAYTLKIRNFQKTPNNSVYDNWFADTKLKKKKITADLLRYGGQKYLLESQYLYNKIKVLCIILVRNDKNARAAKLTWGKSCNKIKFINLSASKRKLFPIKKTKANSAWTLLCQTLRSLSNFFNWILIVNDTTFAMIENLRLLVAPLNDSNGFYLGHAVTFWKINYNIGQAGYVLSRGSLLALQKKLNNNESCVTEATFLNREDFYLGKLLSTMNIFPEDTRDSLGLSTFHSYNLQQEFYSGANYYKMSLYPVTCCSPQSITFQATEADKIYMHYYLIYHLQVFRSGTLGSVPASTPIPEEEVWRSFLKERGIQSKYVSSEQYYKIWEDLVHDPTAFAQQMRQHKNEYE